MRDTGVLVNPGTFVCGRYNSDINRSPWHPGALDDAMSLLHSMVGHWLVFDFWSWPFDPNEELDDSDLPHLYRKFPAFDMRWVDYLMDVLAHADEMKESEQILPLSYEKRLSITG
jgi:hypothetical protein